MKECWSSDILEINQYSFGRINLVDIDESCKIYSSMITNIENV